MVSRRARPFWGWPSALRLQQTPAGRGRVWVWAQAFFKPCNGVQNGLRHGVHFALLQKVFASVHRGQRRRHSGKGPGGAFEQAARLQSAGGGVKKPGKPDRLPGFLNEPSAGSTGAPLGTAPF